MDVPSLMYFDVLFKEYLMSATGFRVIKDNIAVQRVEKTEKDYGGFVLKESADSYFTAADVVTAGPECKHIHEGDRIIISKFSGDALEIGEESYLILTEDEVRAILSQ